MLSYSRFFHFNLEQLSRFRPYLMGMAALFIILCHAAASHVLMPNWLGKVLRFGNSGVDLFLFLSGLGCYYSLSKTTQGGIITFYKRRLSRLLPAYLIIYVPLNAVLLLIGVRSVFEVALSLTTLEFWLFHRGAWFISLIIPLYFLSPLLFKAMRSRRKWFWTIGLILALTLVCSISVSDQSKTSVLNNILGALGRVPSFILGMAIAQECMEKKQISVLWPIVLAVLFFPLYRFIPTATLIWMLVPLMLLLLVWVIRSMIGCHWVESSLGFMGRISLESYLMNISLNSLLSVLITHYRWSSPLLYGNYVQYLIVVFFGTLLAYLVNIVCKWIVV